MTRAREAAAGKVEAIEIHGEARPAGPNTALEAGDRQPRRRPALTLQVGNGRPIRAGYRDLSLIAIQQSTVLLSSWARGRTRCA